MEQVTVAEVPERSTLIIGGAVLHTVFPSPDLLPGMVFPGAFLVFTDTAIGIQEVDHNTLILTSRSVQRRIRLPSGDLTLTVT